MAYQPYRPQGRKAKPVLPPGEDISLEELMAELVRHAREQAASDAADGLLGRVRQEFRKLSDDENGQ